MPETFQSTGSRAKFIYALETDWGVVNASPTWRHVRLVPGESMDENLQLYRSREMRGDRTRNATVRGSQRPAGALPFELSPEGWNPFWWHLLGGSVTTTGPVAGLTTPAAPTVVGSGTGGALPAATYSYRITAINAVGETLASPSSTGVVATGTTSRMTLSWAAVTGATGYRIYGRTGASFLFIASVGAVTTYVDFGLVTPAGASPGSDTSGQIYTHVIKGSVALPTGFTLQKGFLDQGLYIPFYGNRVSRLSLDSNIDNMVAGSWELMSRQTGEPSQTSLNVAAEPTIPTTDPFTSAQFQVYEGASLALLGTCRQQQVMIDNNFYSERGYILGSSLRQNLKPGDRVTTMSGSFMFKDAELYRAAIRGDRTKYRVLATNGTYSVQVDFPKFQLLPNGTTPKATDDGNIDISAQGEALFDTVEGTDVIVTIKSPEAVITN